MSEAATKVLIEPGRRTGRTLANEPKFRQAIDAGQDCYTSLNGVFFRVSVDDSGAIVYSALAMRPVGI